MKKIIKLKRIKKINMYYKIKELFEKGLNKSQISIELGISRKRVRTYLNMKEIEFLDMLERGMTRKKKLDRYYGYIRDLLEAYPYLSSSQVEDRLKENFSDLPLVNSKTVYNIVKEIRNKYNIPNNKESKRQYEKLCESEYGMYGQGDFGEYNMIREDKVSRKRVYFFAMVLCRSRQKFVYFQSVPFTTSDVIEAHIRAFIYYGGIPRKIIYDLDKLFVIDENLGDILMTKEFKRFCEEMEFEAVFCRKKDPESKGKIENVIKFIKGNFLRGRIYKGNEELNRSAQGWLMRTGNGKEHSGTKKIPMEEWNIEKQYLKPLKPFIMIKKEEEISKYKIRKDNTICYKSNFYTLPLGTYKDRNTWVYLKEIDGKIRIYDENKNFITSHCVCHDRGKTIRNNDHLRDKSQSIEQLKKSVIDIFPGNKNLINYIELIYKDKPRYFRDNMLMLKKHLNAFNEDILMKALDFCMVNRIYNSKRFIDVAMYYKKEKEEKEIKFYIPEVILKLDQIKEEKKLIPDKRDINTYEQIIKNI